MFDCTHRGVPVKMTKAGDVFKKEGETLTYIGHGIVNAVTCRGALRGREPFPNITHSLMMVGDVCLVRPATIGGFAIDHNGKRVGVLVPAEPIDPPRPVINKDMVYAMVRALA